MEMVTTLCKRSNCTSMAGVLPYASNELFELIGHGGEEKTMKVARAIAGMGGGAGEFSYTRNSVMQSQSINILKPIWSKRLWSWNYSRTGAGARLIWLSSDG